MAQNADHEISKSNEVGKSQENDSPSTQQAHLPSFYKNKSKIQIMEDIQSKIDLLIIKIYQQDTQIIPTNKQINKNIGQVAKKQYVSGLNKQRVILSNKETNAQNNQIVNTIVFTEEKSLNNQCLVGYSSHRNKTGKERPSNLQIFASLTSNINNQIHIKDQSNVQQISNNTSFQQKIQEEDDESSDHQQEQLMKSFKHLKLQFEEQSLGMKLYYSLIKHLMIIFLVLTVNAILAMSFNYKGNGISRYTEMSKLSRIGQFVAKLSNANQNDYEINTLNADTMEQITQNQNYIVKINIINTILIMCFILYWNFKSNQIIRQFLKDNPQSYQYTLQCFFHFSSKEAQSQNKNKQPNQLNNDSEIFEETQIDKDVEINKNIYLTEQIIKDHLIKWGSLAQISIIRRYSNFVHLVMSFIKLLKKQARIRLRTYSAQKKKAIYEHLQRRYMKLLQFYLSLKAKRLCQEEEQYISFFDPDETSLKNTTRQIPIKSAFIVFNSIQNRDYIKQLYQHKLFLSQKFALSVGQKKYHLEVKTCNIKPLNINWQNYHYGQQINRKRLVCQIVIIVFILLMITLGLFLLNINKLEYSSLEHNDSLYKFKGETSSLFQLASFLANNTSALSYSQQISLVGAYCDQNGNEILADLYPQACRNFKFQGSNVNFILMLFFSLFIFLINLLTSKILRALVLYRRYRTINQKDYFLIISMAICSLINNALIVVIIRHSFTGPLLAKIISLIIPLTEKKLMSSIEMYPYFNRRWHIIIGNQLISNFVFSLIIMPFNYLIIYGIRKIYRDHRQKKKSIVSQKKQFDYCLFYALLLKTYLFCMLYSGTLPILYLLSFISYICLYSISKISLKLFLVPPLLLDQRVNKIALKMFPIGLLVHVISSVYTIFLSDIFPSFSELKNVFLNGQRLQNKFISQYTYLFIGTIIIIFFQNKIVKIVSRTLNSCKKMFDQNEKQLNKTQSDQQNNQKSPQQSGKFQSMVNMTDSQKIQRDNQSKNIFLDLLQNKKILNSFMIKDNPKYKLVALTLELVNQHTEQLLRNKSQIKQFEQTQFCQDSIQ